MVTICTTRFNIQQFYVQPTQCIYVFCTISEQTAIINWLVFITETERVYCAVRTGSLCIIQVYLVIYMVNLKLCTHTFVILDYLFIYLFIHSFHNIDSSSKSTEAKARRISG